LVSNYRITIAIYRNSTAAARDTVICDEIVCDANPFSTKKTQPYFGESIIMHPVV